MNSATIQQSTLPEIVRISSLGKALVHCTKIPQKVRKDSAAIPPSTLREIGRNSSLVKIDSATIPLGTLPDIGQKSKNSAKFPQTICKDYATILLSTLPQIGQNSCFGRYRCIPQKYRKKFGKDSATILLSTLPEIDPNSSLGKA